MTYSSQSARLSRIGEPALAARLFGWAMLSILFGFLVNNILVVGYGFPGISGALSGTATPQTWIQVAIYGACIAVAAGVRAASCTTPVASLIRLVCAAR